MHRFAEQETNEKTESKLLLEFHKYIPRVSK